MDIIRPTSVSTQCDWPMQDTIPATTITPGTMDPGVGRLGGGVGAMGLGSPLVTRVRDGVLGPTGGILAMVTLMVRNVTGGVPSAGVWEVGGWGQLFTPLAITSTKTPIAPRLLPKR